MAQPDTQAEANEGPSIAQEGHDAPTRRRPRRTFWSWLLNRPVEPEPPSLIQLRAEWAEYQVAFNDLIIKFSALLARQVKAEKKRAERNAEPTETPAAFQAPASGKAALRSQVAYRMYGDRIGRLLEARNGGTENEPSSQE